MHFRDRREERTGFQESGPYKASYDLQTDFVMVYGIDQSMPQRVKDWRDKGYVVHLMTGVSWGEYQSYLNGQFDGQLHWDEGQRNQENQDISHGKDVPYMVPSISFSKFLTERIKIAVDEGVEAIHLEEPEFWVEGGYSEAFKREWQIYYKEPWLPPHQSEEAQYRASKLKAYLYTRTLDRLCSELKEYALSKYHRFLRFYVPTHSLINYTQWQIISPESKLIDLPAIDGYIAQIWTGTSRTPNVYEGVRKERTFETAFLEYGMMQELVSGTDRRMWFLHDPIEDNPRHTWTDYQENYFKTVVASLLHPDISHFEVSPWPRRIFEGKRPSEDAVELKGIPAPYATTLLTVMHTLGDMDQEDIQIAGKSEKIGILVADSMMYQRKRIDASDRASSRYDGTGEISIANYQDQELLDFSHFYGMALPLLKRGLWVRPVQLDNVRRFSNYLDQYRLLMISYEFLKPEYPDIHNVLAQWVKEGGILIYVGDDSDPYHQVKAWWNTGHRKHRSPRGHLFESLGLSSDTEQGVYKIDQGVLGFLNLSPDKCAKSKANSDVLREFMNDCIEKYNKDIILEEKNHFLIQRGPYTIAAVLDESINAEPLELKGMYVDLFDPELKVNEQVTLHPNENTLLYDLNYRPSDTDIKLIAASSRVEKIEQTKDGLQMIAKGPEKLNAVARLSIPKEPNEVKCVIEDTEQTINWEWDQRSKTIFLQYIHNSGKETTISLNWKG
ncbi:hypothetical protein JOD43_001308 [Pullulanibacillus pueri]|uniref:Uncharacterized protein n=1 Tax=Pullulanibacillus pueri TaxID=1437324 RepID=A0A8J3EKX6_9BACL|nr:hypothetical protein [Pullulanibacillus pueri]MBM7681141.1 hypothetical protein [Pullulanibacillus pueri]GGH77205.1 hypothetical protein GCM10007096_08760 [Pullulanibacillus pueri]